LIVFSSGLASCQSLQLGSKREALLRRVFEEEGSDGSLNVTAAVSVIEEESERVGRTPEEHFLRCFPYDMQHPLKRNDVNEVVDEFHSKSATLYFRRAEEVMDVIKSDLPTAHVMLLKLFNNDLEALDHLITKLDHDSSVFLRNLRTTVLEMLVSWSSNKSHRAYTPILAKAITKVLTEFKGLPIASKNNLEKTTCFRTFLRIEDQSGRIGEIQEALEGFVTRGRAIEYLKGGNAN
ncbi:hypothetical protein PENTCL1PPCAC_14337, partial [Pristionchus entomophagus]